MLHSICMLLYRLLFYFYPTTLLLRTQSPCPQRQSLYPHNCGLDIPPESNDSNNDTQYVHNIVSVGRNIAHSATINATVLVALKRAREGLRDKRALEEVGLGRDGGWRACRGGEHVDGFEDEEARERAAEVGDTGTILAYNTWLEEGRRT